MKPLKITLFTSALTSICAFSTGSTGNLEGNECQTAVKLESKLISPLGAYEYDAEIEGVPVAGDDGFIWIFDTAGHVHRSMKASKNKTKTSPALEASVKAAVAKFGMKAGQSKVVVGTADGTYHCYDSSGNTLKSGKAQGSNSSFLLTPPIAYDTETSSQMFFISDGGFPYVLDENCIALQPFGNMSSSPGTITTSPAVFTTPRPTLTYVTKVPSGLNKSNHYLNFVSSEAALPPIQIPEPVSFQPLVTQINGSEKALLVSDTGKVFQTGYRGPGRDLVLVDLNCSPNGPINEIGDNLYSVICVDRSDGLTKSLMFTASGKIYPDKKLPPIREMSGKVIAATPTSLPTLISSTAQKSSAIDKRGSKNRDIALIGFSDSYVRAVDIKTGIELAKFKTTTPVQIAPSKIGSNDEEFFIVEGMDPNSVTPENPDGRAKAHHIRLEKSPVPQVYTANITTPCTSAPFENPAHRRPFSLR